MLESAVMNIARAPGTRCISLLFRDLPGTTARSSQRFTGDQATNSSKQKFDIRPKYSLIDEKVNVQVTGLRPHQPVTIAAKLEEKNNSFMSFGHFVSDSIGGLDLSKHASKGGTYTGVDQMGIFWSIEPGPNVRPGIRFYKKNVTTPSTVDLSLHDTHISMDDCLENKNILTTASVERAILASDVTRVVIAEGRLRGVLFIPPGPGPFPAVLDLFGTGGGLMEHRAALLASRGYLTLALAFFQYEDLPKTLADVDLDYFEEAVEWLSSHALASPDGIGTIAISKGCEYACLAACHSSKVKASVNINTFPYVTLVDLKHKGKVIPAGPFEPSEIQKNEHGLIIKSAYGHDVPQDSFIPFHKSTAQFLFVYGMMDDMADADRSIQETVRLFKEQGKTNMELSLYPGTGHAIEPPYTSPCIAMYHRLFNTILLCGGEKAAHAHAQEQFWRRTLQFFDKHLIQPITKASRL